MIKKEQSKDTGLALTLICLLVTYFSDWQPALLLAIIALLLTMSVPGVFGPFARLWFGLSHFLGEVMSRLLLTLLFFLLVIPVGMIRRMLGKDAMQLKAWQKDTASVFRVREHTFTSSDLDKPY